MNYYFSPENIIIRNINIADRVGIFSLIDILNAADRLDYSITEEWFDFIVKEANEGIYVVYYNGNLIAIATCISDNKTNIADINILVHPEYRKQGIGSLLYERVLREANDKKLSALECSAKRRMKDTIRFLDKRGFQSLYYTWEMEMDLKCNTILFDLPSDISLIKALITDYSDYVQIINSTFGYMIDKGSFLALFRDPSIEVYYLHACGRVVGTATIQIRENAGTGYIYDIAIQQGYRGKGLGSLLLNFCLMTLKKKKMSKASLVVEGKNDSALRLYKKHGFAVTDTGIYFQKILG